MLRAPWFTKSVPWTLLLGSLAMVVVGARGSHEVCTVDAEELAEVLGFAPFETISDRQMIIDATFAGVIRKGGKLYSTYDRSQPAGKRACPT